MFNYLRSIIFSIVMFTTVIFFSIICLATTILPYHLRYPCLIIWPRLTIWFAKTICGINYVIHGKENIPKEGAIIVANHQSTWETLAFLSFFPHACFVLKKQSIE
jgi:1-acyl-sn-glycerol-3-phosphate acyltransferase